MAAGAWHNLAVTSTGAVYAWGYNANGQVGDASTTQRNAPTLLATLSEAVGVAAGDSHSLAWTSTGTLWAWGSNA